MLLAVVWLVCVDGVICCVAVVCGEALTGVLEELGAVVEVEDTTGEVLLVVMTGTVDNTTSSLILGILLETAAVVVLVVMVFDPVVPVVFPLLPMLFVDSKRALDTGVSSTTSILSGVAKVVTDGVVTDGEVVEFFEYVDGDSDCVELVGALVAVPVGVENSDKEASEPATAAIGT